ncbi:heterokaryon incompatibility protein-domain-containing protein [Paraphoma chrysanthemicola]|nr:heterokaryon incompatibility protein-domain-containing protein [Paraphoma chrysanthemicola]
MVNESEYSVADYEGHYVLPDAKEAPLAIRLIQIQPRKPDESPFSSTIKLKMRVVNLASSYLLKGESVELTGRPSVRFDEEMNVEQPEEYFGIPRSSMPMWNTAQDEQPPEHEKLGRLSRLASKLSLKAKAPKKDLTIVPMNEIPEGEPKMRDRFTWGNYVAMSYSWGKKEEWEMTDEDRKEAAEKEEARKKRWNNLSYDSSDDEEEKHTNDQYTDGEVHHVLLDGRRIRVRYNLWAALLAFREMKPFQSTWLWNDALCINQQMTDAGFKERARQIPLMSVIYRQAGNIIVHLGGGYFRDEDTPWVLDYLQGISANYRTEYYEALDHAEPIIAQSHRQKAKVQLERSAKEWVEGVKADLQKSARQGDNDYAMISLYDFFDRPYWRRLWIIQELAMAHPSAPILCGDFVTQWRYIRDGALLLSMMADTVRDAMQRALKRENRTMKSEPSFEHVAAIAELSVSGTRKSVQQTDELLLLLKPGVMETKHHSNSLRVTSNGIGGMRMPLMKTLPGSPIQQSLTLAADAQCFMDKDRVLGLLAIPALSTLPLHNATHFASLPTTDIYVQYAKACIQADHSLGIFAFLEGGMSNPDKGRRVPSWCPAFHLKSKIGRLQGDWHPHPRRPKYTRGDSESWDFEYEFAPKFEGDIMTCPGWVIDSVDGLGALSASDMSSMMPGSLFKAGLVPPRFKPDWSDIKDEYDYNSNPIMQGVPTRIWSTLVGGTSTHGKKAPDSFKCLLTSFPESRPRDSDFLYKRNWDFLQANRDLPVGGKPISSYFTSAPTPTFDPDFRYRPAAPSDPTITEAHRAMEARTKFRRLMTTSKRPLMGLVPASTQQGDIVIILWYHSRPLIATAVEDSASEGFKFLLKGEAFIPGIMDGELVDSGELEGMEMTNFKFC